MQPAGLFVMIASVGTVTVLFGWCVWQVLTQPTTEVERIHGAEFETPDAKRG
jgi:hypothetical protein